MEYRVKISEALLDTMTLAALEAYILGDGRKKTQIETFGYIWGTRVVRADVTHLHLQKGSVSLSAQRSTNSVQPNQEAVELKNAVISRWTPELMLLGDFHTHPYASITEVNEVNGFEFSRSDFNKFLTDGDLWEESDNIPIMLAMTVCEVQAVHEDMFGTIIRGNIFMFNIGQYRLWINVAVGYLDEDGNRQHTGNTHSPVFLDMTRFFNQSGDRL